MAETKVTMGVRKLTATVCAIDISGEITAAAENMLMDAYAQAATQGATSILLNFNDLGYMNSSGIGLLVTLLIRTRRQQHRLLAYGLSDHYRQIFELTRLNDAIVIHADEAQALRALATTHA